ncbi:MAG: NUDIX domain-containing protein [Bacteriovoracaceae bacterium]|nr:NUDIX domain-containing protein [Bacteriovoracaceae bacterium]
MPLLHKKIQIVTYTLEQEDLWILLFKTNKKRGNFWQNITGSVETTEDPFDAAWREAQEETGFSLAQNNLKDLHYSFSFLDKKKNKNFTEYVFALPLEHKKTPTLDPNEHEDFKWVLSRDITTKTYYHSSNYEAYVKTLLFLESY